ncbi:MAG: hypothetical protein U1D55_04115 [Phycisphaerae bacterium]
MSNSPHAAPGPADAFARFWTDLVTRLGAAGFAAPMGGFGFAPGAAAVGAGQPSADAIKQMQRIFFDAYGKYCDDFMRSPQFLETLKQSMDGALAFKRQMDAFLSNALKSAQLPSHENWVASAESMVQLQKRIAQRLDDLSARIEGLEEKAGGAKGKAAPAARGKARSATKRAK